MKKKKEKVGKVIKKSPQQEILELKENIERNQRRISDESRRPTGMSYGEMKGLINSIKIFKSKIKALEVKIKK